MCRLVLASRWVVLGAGATAARGQCRLLAMKPVDTTAWGWGGGDLPGMQVAEAMMMPVEGTRR